MKKIGLLAPIFSLPNNFGIGDFSDCSFLFIDYLSLINYSYWQILPLNPIDKFNSPYQSVSSFALDEIYVSIPDLKERGLINEYEPYSKKSKRINYKKVRLYKQSYLLKAFTNFMKKENHDEILNAFKNEQHWVYNYASYVVLKRKNKNLLWNKWTKETLESFEIQSEVNFEIFTQYILFSQWDKIHRYAKKKGISIIGDLPFYVGYDSMDVYFNKECFLLNKDNSPRLVAGVPPDYFAKDGQLWGNPIYNWDYLKENDYKFIFDRILHVCKIFDVVRLDHFRAFDTYYTIDAKADNARIGAWLETPSYDFFDKLFLKKNDIKLIAEDLGMMRDEVYKLRDHYSLPGMQVIQFTIMDEEINHNFLSNVYKRENSIIYLATHDNETTMEWFNKMSKEDQNILKEYLNNKFGVHHIMTNLFKYAASQPAFLCIFTISDVLRLGRLGRINTPGIISKRNWTFRLKDFNKLYANIKKLKNIARKSDRN